MKKEIIECFTWLANRVSESTTYEKWSDSFCRKDVKEAMDVFLEELKKLINWEDITKEEALLLRFKVWQSDEDVDEEIGVLFKDFQHGNLTIQEYEAKVTELNNEKGLYLIPLYLLPILPVGTTVYSIFGKEVVYDGNNIDNDIRFGCLSYGIKINDDEEL